MKMFLNEFSAYLCLSRFLVSIEIPSFSKWIEHTKGTRLYNIVCFILLLFVCNYFAQVKHRFRTFNIALSLFGRLFCFAHDRDSKWFKSTAKRIRTDILLLINECRRFAICYFFYSFEANSNWIIIFVLFTFSFLFQMNSTKTVTQNAIRRKRNE